MTYILCDVNGYVQDVASISGWWDVINEVGKYQMTGPLIDFVTSGNTSDPEGVASEITKMLPQVKDAHVRVTLISLIEGLKKAKEIGIISQ